MKIEQIYTGCLSQGAYYIKSEGEVAIIDPLRESQPYLNRASEDNAKIKYILETHFHADFVSGLADLAKKTPEQLSYLVMMLKSHLTNMPLNTLAISILKSRFFFNLVDIVGDFKSMVQTTIPKSNYICLSTI